MGSLAPCIGHCQYYDRFLGYDVNACMALLTKYAQVCHEDNDVQALNDLHYMLTGGPLDHRT